MRSLRTAVGNKIRALVAAGVQPETALLRGEIRGLVERLAALETDEQSVSERLNRILALAAAQRDAISWLQDQLAAIRHKNEYAALWDEREPLISVRMATWNRANVLVDRAIASVLRQTYDRFEVVIVGDGCTDDTEDRVRKLGDKRIRFHNLPFHTQYPEDPRHRWMVMGSLPRNVADHMAQGSWLAPLDDDDEFTDDHLEVLLATALQGRHEFAYGMIERRWTDIGLIDRVGSYPPASGAVGLQAAIYPRLFAFFSLDPLSWALDESHDWTLVRRMIEAGVRIGFTDRLVTRITTQRRYPDPAHIRRVEARTQP